MTQVSLAPEALVRPWPSAHGVLNFLKVLIGLLPVDYYGSFPVYHKVVSGTLTFDL